jgi:hypothetical protein
MIRYPSLGLTIAMEEVDETDDIDEARCDKTIEEDVEGWLKRSSGVSNWKNWRWRALGGFWILCLHLRGLTASALLPSSSDM